MLKNQQEGSKKSPFDELSRDELISKCKGLLAIAQKARYSKQELQSEIDRYKIKQDEYEKEKNICDVNLHTLQELADSLTEQKLIHITDLECAQSNLKTLNQKCLSLENEIKRLNDDIILRDKDKAHLLLSLSNLDSDNISLKRQNNRLIEKNEQLLTQLSELEARIEEFNNLGLQQRDQLKILEEKIQSEGKFKIIIQELNNKIAKLENEFQNPEANINYHQQLLQYENKIKELTQLYEKEKENQEKSNIKLRSYKDKISKCATCINQLKNSRFILSKTVKEYSENIPKWQSEILAASIVLDGQIKKLSQENSSLKEKLAIFEDQIKQGVPKDYETNDAKLQAEIKLLRNQILDLKTSNNSIHNTTKLREHIEFERANDQQSHCQEAENATNPLNLQLEEVSSKYTVLLEKNAKLLEELQSLQNKNEQLNELFNKKSTEKGAIECLQLQIRAMENEKSILVKEKLNARDNALESEGKNNVLNNQMSKMQSDVKIINLRLDELLKENTILKSNVKTASDGQINKLKSQMAALHVQNDLMKKEYENMVDMNGLLKEEVETLKLLLEQPKENYDNVSELNVSLQADIVKLETKLSAYKQENSSLLAELKESRSKMKEFETLISENEDTKLKLSGYKTENAELLNEMKEINQVLKERGESISKLQKAVCEMETLIDTLEKDRDVTNREKEELLKSIDTLEYQLNNVKLKTTLENGSSQELLAEKENATKSLLEKEKIIMSLKDELEKLKQQQTCPAEITNDDMSTSTISKAEENARMRDLDETFEEKYTKLRIFALKLKKKLNETTTQLRKTEKDKERLAKLLGQDNKTTSAASNDELDQCQKEREQSVNQIVISELESKVKTLSASVQSTADVVTELEAIKAEVTNVNQRLSAEVEAHKLTKESLEKARRDVKKKNVLSLEMEDYERSMKELTFKMEENKKKIVQMESTIDTQEGIIASMKVQINLLEEQIKTEETQNRLVKEELQNALDEMQEKDNLILAKNGALSKLEQDLEDEKRKNEESNIEMTSLLSDKEKIIISLGQDKAELNHKMKKIDLKCAEVSDQLNITKIELEDLKTEYTSYKVRAQAVLRQNQTVDHSQEEHLKEEAAAFKAHIDTLTAKLMSVQGERAEAAEEVAAARRRAAEAAAEQARTQQRAARLHADMARLTHQLDSEKAHHKLQVSTLTQCYKTQMAEMEERFHKEVDDLKNQLVLAQAQAASQPGSSSVDDDTRIHYVVPVIPKEDSDGEMDINVSLIPREEGEGSECVPSPPPGRCAAAGGGRSPVSLEMLLERGVSEDEPEEAVLSLSSEQQLLDLRRKLVSQQQRVKHVTVLLAESERECARLAQLSELLKGELRRGRAAPAGAHNTEYMKNVTFKFVTLPPGDERSRLVPVLQKILSLTHDETNKIQAVAKGMDPNPKGWGSYLPWPGGK